MKKRIMILFFGFTLIAYGVSMVIHVSEVGIEPWAALNIGLEKKMWTYGIWNMLFQGFFILLTWIIEKRPPRAGTFVNMVYISLMVDVFVYLNSFFYVDIDNVFVKYFFFVFGVAVTSFGTVLAIISRLGTGAKTQFYVTIHEKLGYKLSHCKYAMELLGLILALIFGGPIFLGTLIFVFISGYFIGLFNEFLSRKIRLNEM